MITAMSRLSPRARVVMAVLAFPLLLGCGCCDVQLFADDRPPLNGDRPSFTADQVVGVWTSECGGKVSIRDDGTYRADGLVIAPPGGQPPLTGSDTWSLFPGAEHNDQAVDLEFGDRNSVRLRA